MAFGIWRPHTPFTAPGRFFELYDQQKVQVPPPGYRPDDLEDVPVLGRKLAKVWGERFILNGPREPDCWREFVWAYLACTSFADWSLGQVLQALDESPYRENTIVVFWSDNGYHCGEKDHWEKTTLWEQAARVPLAIRVPWMKYGGGVCRRPVSLVDLFPTLVELCQLDPPEHRLKGRSLRPLLERPTSPWDRPALTTYGEGYGSVRDEQFRYIRYPDGTEELYDHESDPYEFDNLAQDPAFNAIKQRLKSWLPQKWARSLGGRLG